MKRTRLVISAVSFCILVIGLQLLAETPRRTRGNDGNSPDSGRNTRDWAMAPQDLMMNFYDYMPGGRGVNPLRAQVDANGDLIGVYGVFHGMESLAFQRNTSCFRVTPDGLVEGPVLVAPSDLSQGYPTLVVDPDTNNPFVAYHRLDPDEAIDRIEIVMDRWNDWGQSGLFTPIDTVFDNLTQGGIDSPFPGDRFGWPNLFISKAPSYNQDGKRRLYVLARNSTDPVPFTPNTSENLLLCYKDFDMADIDSGSFFQTPWTYRTFPYLDNMNNETSPMGRYYPSMDVSWDGRLAILGSCNYFPETFPQYTTSALLFYNAQYGEGEWQIIENELTVPYTPTDPPPLPHFWDIGGGTYPQVCLGESEVRFVTNMSLCYSDDTGFVFELPSARYMKEVVVNLNTHTHRIIDLFPQGDHPDDGIMYDPRIWDPWEMVYTFNRGWPVWYHDVDQAFHQNWQKYAVNNTHDWRVAIWQDGLKNRLAHEGEAGYEQWLEVPELCLQVWNGASFDPEPIVLSALNTPELEGMIPIYWYPCTEIIDLGNGYGRLYLMFFDDYDYGSYFHYAGLPTGGMMKICALDINFGYHAGSDPEIPYTPQASLTAWPNPFNPLTKVNYSVPESGPASVVVHNIRGQKVKTLFKGQLPAGNHTFEWNGKDDHGQACSTGIYLIKGSGATGSIHTKVTLLK